MKKIFLQIGFLILLLTGCADDTLPKYYALGGFRVLGIHVNTPDIDEASLPAAVTMTPIISDLNSGGRAISLTVTSCPDPGVSYGANPSCDGVLGASAPVDYNAVISSQSVGSTVFGSPSYTGTLDVGSSITATIPAGVLTGRTAIDKFNGVGYLITFNFRAGAEVIRAYKRITVFSGAGRIANTNPSISSLGLSALPTSETNVVPSVSLGQTDYQLMNENSEISLISKNHFITYFITDGSLKKSRTDVGEAAVWTPPTTSPGRPVTFVGIIYDGIGGMNYKIVNLN